MTAAQVRSDGSFTLALPANRRYRLEVLTTSGVRHVLSRHGGNLGALSFQVCEPADPWDIGGVGDPPCLDPMDPSCNPPPCQAGDPSCSPPCSDPTDPNCGGMCTDPSDPNCKPPWPCQPGDPSCGTVCTDPTDPNCLPPPPFCMDPTDPYCKCDAAGECPPPTCDPNDAMCPPEPPPPCADPTDPTTCKDPCFADPASCGCGMEDPNCWPPPQPPDCDAAGTMCDPGDGGMTPDHPPGDFGCKEATGL